MKEIVPQKPLEPVLHGFLLRDRKLVTPSKSKVLKFLGIFSTEKIKTEEI